MTYRFIFILNVILIQIIDGLVMDYSFDNFGKQVKQWDW